STILQGQQHLRTAEVQIKNTTQPRLWLEVTLFGLLPSAAITQAPTLSNQQSLPKFPSNLPKTNNHTPTTPSVQQTPPTVPQNQPSHPPASQNTETPKQQENGAKTQHTTSQPATSTQPTPSSPSNSSPPPQTNLTQIWQQVLANLIPVSRRELLRQMCHIVEFDGSVARVAAKQAWYERVKQDYSKIATAFQVTFSSEIKVNLEIANAASSANSNSSVATPTVQQQKNVTATQTAPQTAPQPAPSPVPTPTKTEPPQTSTPTTQRTVAAKKTVSPPQKVPTPPQPIAIAENPEMDEVMKAARRLADALDGEIIQLSEENTEISDESIDSPELEEPDEEDIEF
ncbi:MAG: DNA polymerase III subunit gamma/tau, partial [Cyanobacteria bacterium P01_H01_bin.150]